MRSRQCQACRAVWRARSARFCGVCGQPLATAPPGRRGPLRFARPGWLARAVVALLATGAMMATTLEMLHVARPPGPVGRVDVGERPTSGAARDVVRPADRPKTIGGGMLVVVEEGRLVASNAADGTTRFDVALARLDLAADRLAPGPGALSLQAHHLGVVVAGGGTTVGVDRDGEPQWTLRSPRTATRVVAADGERAVLSGPVEAGVELLEVVEVADGTVRFSREIATLVGVEEQTALVRDPDQDAGVTAVSLHDGVVRWRSGSPSLAVARER